MDAPSLFPTLTLAVRRRWCGLGARVAQLELRNPSAMALAFDPSLLMLDGRLTGDVFLAADDRGTCSYQGFRHRRRVRTDRWLRLGPGARHRWRIRLGGAYPIHRGGTLQFEALVPVLADGRVELVWIASNVAHV